MNYLKPRFTVTGENSKTARDNFSGNWDSVFRSGTSRPQPKSARPNNRAPAPSEAFMTESALTAVDPVFGCHHPQL
jgi:hypothetical protein